MVVVVVVVVEWWWKYKTVAKDVLEEQTTHTRLSWPATWKMTDLFSVRLHFLTEMQKNVDIAGTRQWSKWKDDNDDGPCYCCRMSLEMDLMSPFLLRQTAAVSNVHVTVTSLNRVQLDRPNMSQVRHNDTTLCIVVRRHWASLSCALQMLLINWLTDWLKRLIDWLIDWSIMTTDGSGAVRGSSPGSFNKCYLEIIF